MKNNYVSRSHSLYNLTIHLILRTKHEKGILVKFEEDIKRYVFETSKDKRFEITKMEIDNDNLHMIINFEPSCSVGYIVKVLKSGTTYLIWQEHESYLKKHFWNRKHVLWSGGYYVCTTVGEIKPN